MKIPSGVARKVDIVSDTWPAERYLTTSNSGNQDEDEKPTRGGSLERDKPTFLL
jgi:hypothetical protein